MFVGHYAASLAAKSGEPRAPLWSYVAGAQLIDIGWGALVLGGAEKVRIDPALPGSVLDLYHMPYTHSLPAVLLWSAAGAVLLKLALKLPNRAAAMVGLVIFSHWILDLLVHRPDLELWFGGTKVGLALWNYPVAEMAIEMGLLAVAGAIWTSARKSSGLPAWPAVSFLALLVAIQVLFLFGPVPTGTALVAIFALTIYGLTTAAAWLVDRHDSRLSAAADRAAVAA